MAYFICEKQGRCCPHEFYDSIEQAITDSEDGVPCDHLIEVATVRHGRWEARAIPRSDPDGDWIALEYHCSLCNRLEYRKENYCPNCGAKMDLDG